jgi:alpha-glucoside transport system substrate-binding protein
MWTWAALALFVLGVVVALIALSSGGDNEIDSDRADATQGAAQDTTAAATDDPGGVVPDLSGKSVTIFGPDWTEAEAGSFQDALDVFNERTGINATFTGAEAFFDNLNVQAVGGNPPDIAIFPHPSDTVAEFAREGLIQAVPADTAAVAESQWPVDWLGFSTVDGTLYGVPNESGLKSLVWYEPARFAADGYTVPETWDELKALSDQIIADGGAPWCVGIESDGATGWPFTDWNEDLLLRLESAEYYDQWVNHEVPFNDAPIENVWNEILDEWNREGAVFAAGGSIAATYFGDNGQPLVDGDCYMHRQASFFWEFFPEGTTFGPDGVDVFYFPSASADSRPVVVFGSQAAAFRDAPEVWEVMKFLTSAEYANIRAAKQSERKGGGLSGYLSANTQADLGNWMPLEQSFIQILQTGGPARLDASDLMPVEVGMGSFWGEATSAVNGDKSAADALQTIEDSWPSG